MSNVEQFNLNGITVDVCDANARDMIGDEYDATATYAVGDYCIYNNTMKKCITAVSTPEAFDSEKWINTTIQEVLETANTKIGTDTLTTSAQDLSGAINEHETDIGRIEYDLGSEALPDITKTVKGNINKIDQSLTNKELWAWSDNTRFQMIDGGYKNMGSYVIINLVVKAKTSATNSPSISSVVSAYKPTVDTALSCIDITSGISSAITDSVPCGISSAAGTIYIKSIITDHIYAITGYYLIA